MSYNGMVFLVGSWLYKGIYGSYILLYWIFMYITSKICIKLFTGTLQNA